MEPISTIPTSTTNRQVSLLFVIYKRNPLGGKKYVLYNKNPNQILQPADALLLCVCVL